MIALQIDLGRQKENIEFIKQFASFSKKQGYDTLFLYLEASVKTSVTSFFTSDMAYTMSELKSIVSYIESIGLTAIPAFENFSHMEQFLRYDELSKFAEFNDENKEGRGFSSQYYKRGSTACINNKEYLKFISQYISEVSSVFSSQYIHMGLDESFEFAECDKCKKILKSGKTKKDMFYEHIMFSYNLVKSLNKTMMMWDDFFEYYDVIEKLPRDIIMCPWHYGYVTDEFKGHWTNRVKKDFLAIYENLGFKYMLCGYTNNASSTYNIDTLTNYGKKYNPVGYLMTTWEKANSNYQGLYPAISYAGKLWSKKISKQDKLNVLSEFFDGNIECASVVSDIAFPNFPLHYSDISKVCECDYMLKYNFSSQLNNAICVLENAIKNLSGLNKEVAINIRDTFKVYYLNLQLDNVGNELFDNYEKPIYNKQYFIDKLENIKNQFIDIKKQEIELWQNHRMGVKSFLNQLENNFDGNIKNVENQIETIKNVNNVAVFYADFMIPDAYASFKGEIIIKYVGEEEKVVYMGNIKPTLVNFDLGGTYSFRYLIENKNVDYAIFNVCGEGEAFPLNFKIILNGKKYYVNSVEKISGEVSLCNNILYKDTKFAIMGYGDGISHLDDVSLSKKKSGIKIYFEK